MKYIFPIWRRYLRFILTAIFFLAIEAGFDLLQPTIVSLIIDEGVKTGSLDIVLRYGGLMLGVAALGACCAVIRCIISSRVSQSFGADLRLQLFSKINTLSFASLGRRETASLITRLTNDTSQLTMFTNSIMRVFVKQPLLLIGAIIMTTLLNLRLTMVLIIVAPVVAFLMYISMRVGFPLFIRMQKAMDKNNAVIREYLSGVRVVKAYNTFDQEVERFDGTNTELTNVSITANRVIGAFQPFIMLMMNTGVVTALWFARDWVANQQMQVGQIIAFINYMTQITFSLGMIFNVYNMFVRAKASADRIGDVLKEEGESTVISAPASEEISGSSVEFKNVTFTYPTYIQENIGIINPFASNKNDNKNDNKSKKSGEQTTAPAIENVSFFLPAGETLGIIGPTGSGKSSLVQLIPAFYPPDSGEILVGGVPLEQLNKNDLRASIAYVAQQNTLFYGTIADNIRMGKADATDEEIIEAAKAAAAHEFIDSFQEKYETIIGQKGVNLSGGQKQRVGIARALVRKAKILVLDDCVSAVDVETEAQIMRAVSQLDPAPTVVLITQRISSVMNLNYILVLDEGRVAGFGNHAKLMEDCPVYREIYNSQLI